MISLSCGSLQLFRLGDSYRYDFFGDILSFIYQYIICSRAVEFDRITLNEINTVVFNFLCQTTRGHTQLLLIQFFLDLSIFELNTPQYLIL